MQAYKQTDKSNRYYGRIIMQINQYEAVIFATPTKPQEICGKYIMSMSGLVLIVLEDEKWVHPHLYKPIKDQIYGK